MDDHNEANFTLSDQEPWPGLRAFVENNASFFYGREKEIEDLQRAVKRNNLTVLFGKSGLGKTSILQAGLAPALRQENFIPIYIRLNHFEETLPLEDQVEVFMENTIAKFDIEAPAPIREETLWEYFHKQNNEWWSKDNNLLKPVLIFDQFEEIITAGQQNSIRATRSNQFLEELEDLIENRPPAKLLERFGIEKGLAKNYDLDRMDYRVVISLREDYLADLESLRERLRPIMINRYRLYPLTEKQARNVVTLPGKDIIDPDVAEHIVNFVANQSSTALFTGAGGEPVRYVEPSLLCVILRELNSNRLALKETKITTELVSKKRPETIMQEFYEQGIEGLDKNVKKFIEGQLLTASGARNRIAEEDAISRFGIDRRDIETLIDRRILQRERISNLSWLELSHDTLVPVVKASADYSKRRRMYIRRANQIGGTMLIAILILASGLMIQLQWKEQQAREAADLGLTLIKQMDNSLSMSKKVRKDLTETLSDNFIQLINKAPDSQLILHKFIAFLLQSAKTDFDQGQITSAQKTIEKAYNLLGGDIDSIPPTDSEHVLVEADVLITLAKARRFQGKTTESIDLLNAADQILLANPEVDKQNQTRTDLLVFRSNMERSNALHNLRRLKEKRALLLKQVSGLENLLSDPPSSDSAEQDYSVADFYQVLLESYLDLSELSAWGYGDDENLPEKFIDTLNRAQPHFSDRADQLVFYEALSYLAKAGDFEKKNITREARLNYDIAIEKLSNLVRTYPDNLNFRLNLFLALKERLRSASVDDLAQSQADYWTMLNLAASFKRDELDPYYFCTTSLIDYDSQFLIETQDKTPEVEPLFKQMQTLGKHCSEELEFGDFFANYEISALRQAIFGSAKLKIDDKTATSIREKQAEILAIIKRQETSGNDPEYIAKMRFDAYITSNNYLNYLSKDERKYLIDSALAEVKNLSKEHQKANAANITWLIANNAVLQEADKNYDSALSLFRQVVGLAIDNGIYGEPVLLQNSLWSIQQQVRLYAQLEDWTKCAEAIAPAIELTEPEQLHNDPKMVNKAIQFTGYLLEAFDKALKELSVSESAQEHERSMQAARDSIQTALSKLGSINIEDDKKSGALQRLTVNDYMDPNLTRFMEQSDEGLIARSPLGWSSGHPYAVPGSHTLSGTDPSLNPALNKADEIIHQVRYSPLPFYATAKLVTVEYVTESKDRLTRYFLEDSTNDILRELNGTSPPIHGSNKDFPLVLDDIEKAISYLRFFTTFVNSDGGAFQLIESVDDLNWQDGVSELEKNSIRNLIRPVYMWQEKNTHDKWHATATVYYSNNIYHAKFEVASDGTMVMVDDIPIATNLKANTFSLIKGSGRISNYTSKLTLDTFDGLKVDDVYDDTHYFLSRLVALPKQERIDRLADFYYVSDFYFNAIAAHEHKAVTYDQAMHLYQQIFPLVASSDRQALFEKNRNSLFGEIVNHKSLEKDPLETAYYSLFAGKFEYALEASDSGLEKDPGNLPLQTNRTHALMFLGKTEEATEIYLKHFGIKIGSQHWEDIIEDDFQQLESVGWSHPLMATIRQEFAARKTAL